MKELDPKLRHRLAAFADGELSAAERDEVARLVASSPAARTEVERTRALRALVHRSLQAEALPEGLRGAVISAVSGSRRAPWLMRSMATAATVLAAIFVVRAGVIAWTSDAEAAVLVVSVAHFATVHQECAIHKAGHDLVEPKAVDRQQLAARVRAVSGFGAHVPDLSAHGYQLVGVCRCFPPPAAPDLRVVHASYRSAGNGAWLSVFSMDRQVRFTADRTEGVACLQYERAASGEFQVIRVATDAVCLAFCSDLSADALEGLVQNVRPTLATSATSDGFTLIRR